MEIEYTEYAENTLLDRKISKELIEKSLKEPDEIIEGKNKRKIAQKIINNKLLRVIFEIKGKAYIIITAYYSDPKRYIK